MVREILRSGEKYTAVDAFSALQRLQELRAEVGRLWQQVDVVVVPTIGRTFTVDEVLAEPIAANTMLGHYTHFGNLLDLTGVAIPQGLTADGRPHSAMLLGNALTDDAVLHLSAALLDEPRSRPATPDRSSRTSTVTVSHPWILDEPSRRNPMSDTVTLDAQPGPSSSTSPARR